jgi:tRNA pseudouridine38-40 synthase
MFHYRLDVSYDGTNYGGWQVQPNAVTVQELIQKAFAVILRQDVAVTGAGRTDAGVHALQQTAHFAVPVSIDPFRLRGSLNGLLPADIRVLRVLPVPSDFHARYSAVGKIYHYEIHLGGVVSPFKRLYCWQVKQKIDVEVLRQAALQFIGTHDFTSFANEAHMGCAARDAVRTISKLDVVVEGDAVSLKFEGDGFLYKMVRNITGTLVECAAGRFAPSHIAAILAAKDRRLAGTAAPSHGLFLVRVNYPEETNPPSS